MLTKKNLAIVTVSLLTLGASQVAGAASDTNLPSLQQRIQVATRPAPASDAVRTAYSGLRSDGSQQPISGTTTDRLWAQTTAPGACLKVQSPTAIGPGSSCFSAQTMAAGNAWNITGSPSRGFRLTAFVPDGAQAASIRLTDGTTRTVAVVRNTIMLESEVNLSSYSYDASGVTHTIPASGFNEG